FAVRQPFSSSCCRVPTFTRMATSCLRCQLQRPGQPLEPVQLPRGAQRDVDLVGAGLHVLIHPVDQLGLASEENAGAHRLAQVSELGREVVLVGGQTQVDAAADLPGIPPHLVAVAVKDPTLAGEVLGRDERDVPAVGVAGGYGQGAALAATAYPDGAARPSR